MGKTKYPVRENMILVALDSKYTYIPKEVFVMLFENSHIYYKRDYIKALEDNKIKFSKLRDLSREAGIPYSLFFAPIEKVEENINKNNEILFTGIQEGPIAIASRGDIRIRDINLIVKDIQKRQLFLAKNHREVVPNPILNLRQQQTSTDMANLIIKSLNLDMDKFRNYSSKDSAYNYLVSCLENNNIIISRSRKGVMPQTIKPGLNFSGFSVKHKKYPAIFLHSKDEDRINDPAGRRIFTIFLLLACIANKRFATVSYNQSVEEPAQNIEYIVAEEILMPEDAISGTRIDNINELENIAEFFKVTPSMALVRLKRLGCIDRETFEKIFELLKNKWKNDSEQQSKMGFKFNIKDTTRIVTYNGKLFTTEVINLLRANKLSAGDASRLLFFKKKSKSLLNELKENI
ncbi:hypothetical protein IJG76_01115 [Candidatus Saccharibacteria bacterium]|nr:hypothetical protein [Candidatus Saccharibacteria bacterium]